MAVQITLDRCGVVLLDRSQGRTAPGSQTHKGPTKPTDCGSASPALARGDQSRATGQHQHHQHLRIMQWNAEGVQHKKTELQNFLRTNSIDICCIQESHLNSSLRFFVRGYEIHRQDRSNRPKGGVLTLVRNTLSSVEVHRSGEADTESISVKIPIADNQHVTVCNLYSPPNKTIRLPSISPDDKSLIVVGDFNSHSPSWGYKDLDAKGEEVEDWMISNSLVLLNRPDDTPTFYSRVWRTTSTPDLAVATDNIQKITNREVCAQLGGSDHKPVILTIQKRVTTFSGRLPPSWNYKKADWGLFKKLTDINTCSIAVKDLSVDKATNLLTTAILEAAKKAIPRGRRRDYKPFWNSELQDMHTQLSAAREEMEKEPSDQNSKKHQQLRADFEAKKKTLTQKSWHEKTASLNLEKDSQKLWQLTNMLNDDNSQRGRTTLQSKEGFLTGKAAANRFAKVYQAESSVNISQEKKRNIREKSRSLRAEQEAAEAEQYMTESLTMSELEEALKKLKLKKAPGPDGVTNEMLKHLGYGAKRILLLVFNLSWHTGKFPSKWKEAHIRPILKKGKDKHHPESYRPISLLSCIGKLLERIINRRLIWHLESHSILTPTQTGYRQHHSTEDQLAYLAQSIEDAFQEKKKVLSVFFDLSKAFDTVWKEGLLFKLQNAGVRGKMYNWLNNFLYQRTARVKLDNTLSNLVKIREGVPQGGVISPTLFLVYINDITSTVPMHVSNTLHADDFAVWCAEQHTSTATHRIQTAINNVSDWADEWALKLSKTKTVTTLFSLSTSKEEIKLKVADQLVPQVETPTFLGVTLDTRLTWKPHIEKVEERSLKKLSLMKKLAGTTWGANSNILRQVYIGAVRPVTEYASTTWATASKTSKGKLDKVQNMGLRIILGAMKTTPIREMEKTADLEPLETRRNYKILVQAEKAKRMPTHPLHQKLNKRTKNRLKRQSLNHLTEKLENICPDVRDVDAANCEKLSTKTWTPRRLSPQINLDVPNLEGKGEQLPALQKSLTLEMMQNRYPPNTWIQAFTDGSAEKAVQNGGSGALIKFRDGSTTTLSFPVGKLSSNYRAEVQALAAASTHLVESRAQKENIVFLTDSLSALQALQSGPTDTTTRQLLEQLNTLSQHNKIVLQWIPAHVGIAGNEAADKLAKAGSKLPQPQTSTSYGEAKTLLRRQFKEEWSNKNENYRPDHDPFNKLDRKGQTTIFRLRTGHCRLGKHMKRIGLTVSAACECGAEEQTPEHILQVCPHLEEHRQQIWTGNTSLRDKLWGSLADLQKTVLFVTSSGLTI